MLLVLYGQPRLTDAFWGVRRTIRLLRKQHDVFVIGSLWSGKDLQPNVDTAQAVGFFNDNPLTVSSDSESIAQLFPALAKLPSGLMFQGLSFAKSLAKAALQIDYDCEAFDIVFVTRTDLYIPRVHRAIDIALKATSSSSNQVMLSCFHHDRVDDNLLFISPVRVKHILDVFVAPHLDFGSVQSGEELREMVLRASNSSILGAPLPYHIGRNSSAQVFLDLFIDACLFPLRRSLPREWFDALTSPRVTLSRLFRTRNS